MKLRENCLNSFFDFFNTPHPKKIGTKNGCKKNSNLFQIKIVQLGTNKFLKMKKIKVVQIGRNGETIGQKSLLIF